MDWREMSQPLRAHTTFAEDWGSVPSTHFGWPQMPVTLAPGDIMPLTSMQTFKTKINLFFKKGSEMNIENVVIIFYQL